MTMKTNVTMEVAMHVTAHAVVAARGGRGPFPSFPTPTIPTLAWVMCAMPVTYTSTVNECKRGGWSYAGAVTRPPRPPHRHQGGAGRFPPIRRS